MENFLIKYGLWAVFFGSAIEADAMPILSGATSHFGYFGFPLALLASICGMFAGDCVWYWIGRIFGNRIKNTEFYKRRFPQVEKFIDRISVFQIVLCRVFYGTRNATMLFWGIKQYSFLRFAFFDILGCIVWGILLVSLGYFLSSSVQLIIGDVKEIEIFLLIIGAIAVILIILKSILSKSEKHIADEK